MKASGFSEWVPGSCWVAGGTPQGSSSSETNRVSAPNTRTPTAVYTAIGVSSWSSSGFQRNKPAGSR